MRAALISLPMPGEGDQPSIAGKSIAERQLLFAREMGCETVIAHGGGASADAVTLRYTAESAGMRFQVISNAHALAGIIASGDSLLVIQPGLLPEAAQALELLRAEGDRMLVVSAGPGTAAGFERIDLDRAWAGAMTLPGSWLEHLTTLPEDVAPHAALLRIGLQKRLPEARLEDGIVDDSRWTIIRSEERARIHERNWLAAHLGTADGAAPSHWAATTIVKRFGSRLLASKWAAPGLAAGAGLALLGGVAAAVCDLPWAAFVLVALAVPFFEGFLALVKVGSAPFGRRGRLQWTHRLIDASLFSVALLSIDGLWYRAAFPAFALFASLLILDRRSLRAFERPFRDRGVAAAALAVLSATVTPEIAVIAVATICLFLLILPETRPRG